MDETKLPHIALNDQERFPLIRDLRFLNQLRQDQHAPHYNFKSGDRLQQSDLALLETYKSTCKKRESIIEGTIPQWVKHYVVDCEKHVPFYKGKGNKIDDYKTFDRETLGKNPWEFVHDKAKLEELLVYSTSGTTGLPMDVNFAPCTQASWLVQLEVILDYYGIKLSKHSNQTAIALICNQDETLTYASLSTYLNGSGILKINLHTSQWNSPNDRLTYLEKYNPEILTGDPFAFAALKALNPSIKPKMMVSSAMRLSNGLQAELESHFNCPVIDVYSMTECRMIAFREGNQYRTIRPDLYLETVDPNTGKILPEGSFGEIVVTGGNNAFLSMIRYKTGDQGCIKVHNGIQYIEQFEAREMVTLYNTKRELINPINISRALMPFALYAYHLHQNKDLSLTFIAWGKKHIEQDIRASLYKQFGNLELTIEINPPLERSSSDKGVVYTSDN